VIDGEGTRQGRAACRCSWAAELPTGVSAMLLAPPLGHTVDRVRSHLRATGLQPGEPAPGLVRVEVPGTILRRLLVELSGILTGPEMRDTRCLLRPIGAAPEMQDLLRAESLEALAARLRGEWLTSMVREERLTAYFQPIVSAADPSEIHAYECLLRGVEADGSLMAPGNMFGVAADAGLLFPLDRAARRACIRGAAAQGVKPRLFVNFTPNAVYDPVFCLRSTAREVLEAGYTPDQVCFEVTESERITDLPHLLGVLAWYRQSGFKVALDDLGSGYSSLNLMSRLRPDYVKLDAELVRGVDRDPYRAGILSHLLQLARNLGVRSVAEGVETREEFEWVRAHGADLVQGYLFARPAAVPPPARPLSPLTAVLQENP
jgi:EAL domain-containing protein (putative c-di-GMP-specific phosphodiesterase class I)